MRCHRFKCAPARLASILAAALLPAAAAAQEEASDEMAQPEAEALPNRPSASKRVVRLFDFEERDFNLEPVPQYWVRAQQSESRSRPGFPPWNEARFDNEQARSGGWSALLPARGGSAALRLASGVIPVLPGGEYAIAAMVRTQGLDHSRARLAARLVDEQHRPIPGAIAVSQAVRSELEWAEVRVELSTDNPEAAWLQIELQLLQPEQLRASGDPFGDGGDLRAARPADSDAAPAAHVASQRAAPQDFLARAWFDDVRVLLVPRLSLTTNSPINVIEAPEVPALTAIVRDMAGETLLGEIQLFSDEGALLASRDIVFQPGGRPIPWRPDVGGFGWRRAVLTLRTSAGQTIARINTDFVWTPPQREFGSIDARRFELLLHDAPPGARDAALSMLHASLAGAVQLPLWREDLSASQMPDRLTSLQPMLNDLLESGAQVALALDPAPLELAQRLRIDPDSSLLLLEHELAAWSSYFREAVARLGQRITRWRVGGAHSAQALRFGDEFSQRLTSLQSAMQKLAPSVQLIAPWPGAVAPPEMSGVDAKLLVSAPAWFPPAGLADVVDNIANADEHTLLIQPRARGDSFDRPAAVDLAARLLWAWRAGVSAVALEQPWTWSDNPRRPTPQPTVLFAALRQTIERLTERRFIADVPAPPGAVAMLFDGPAGGMLVAWAQGPQAVGQRLPVYAGARQIVARDVFGNEWTPSETEGQLQLELTDEPIFLEGVDAPLLALQAGFRVEPAFLPSLATRHELAARIENPYPRAITGAVRIDSPAGWEIHPRVLHFSLGPGESVLLPFEAAFGVSEPAGPRDVWATASLRFGEGERIIRLRAPMEVGLPNVVLTPVVSTTPPRRRGRPGDVLVTLLVTNVGDTPITLEGFAQAPGFPREQAPISDLPPGETGLVRFLFREGADSLSGRDVRVGVMEIAGLARLNAVVEVP